MPGGPFMDQRASLMCLSKLNLMGNGGWEHVSTQQLIGLYPAYGTITSAIRRVETATVRIRLDGISHFRLIFILKEIPC
jgi:hypothetical protein